jgi:hypothetical protein
MSTCTGVEKYGYRVSSGGKNILSLTSYSVFWKFVLAVLESFVPERKQ